MAVAAEIVILLSVGSFQLQLPQIPKAVSPAFSDSMQGASDAVGWLKQNLPEPRFNQPPTRICVVGAVPFTDATAPQIVKPLWESRQPFRRLEPYSASFHYVEPAASAPPPKPRTLRDALQLCAKAWKTTPAPTGPVLRAAPATASAPAAAPPPRR